MDPAGRRRSRSSTSGRLSPLTSWNVTRDSRSRHWILSRSRYVCSPGADPATTKTCRVPGWAGGAAVNVPRKSTSDTTPAECGPADTPGLVAYTIGTSGNSGSRLTNGTMDDDVAITTSGGLSTYLARRYARTAVS